MSEQDLELRTQFFVHYWGQKLLQVTSTQIVEVGQHWNLKHPNFKLKLKPLSTLKDHEALIVGQIENFESKKPIDLISSEDFILLMVDLKHGSCHKFHVVDYLRSKGYALPFMQYSVKDLVEMGWVELSS
ncbi:MAG: hypothetical protein GW772_03695 [Flavobacteriia bacterium]|nr:hypothetical protein [Flavobacteriia bacterium]OIP48732.1 MAG: hypothetical protein AUK46_00205 [Flavobacteriaceae bacterium CG2_30_31_66]PIV95452.1 MAG: hypothetical protein COW43_13030 [Flavobacteriaceae bacterium CG17_big_fil_post_rev_8_21_14_2_50_31_13]PIX13407.1 MAG: hypothetical protein COZ74_06460 [Flavobacteriaceae bacterium CG_4_8_14_3_um_filter_31_8]PIY14161.1 MAG: hypothetical protein COZ16_10190 [Flavobacteriaceae bacterium CG_4_10_14_3_um_filter_31_253]PIZ10270.1 MAG: hypotheti